MDPIPPRFQFTIRQLLKLVLASGLLCAYFLPAARIGSYLVLAFEVAILPMVLGVLVLVFARRGVWNNWLLTLLFLPYPAGMAVISGFAAGYEYVHVVRVTRAADGMALSIMIGLVCAWSTCRMIRQLIPWRCPGCRRRSLLMDPCANLDHVRICVRCGRSFRRTLGGPWEPINDRP
jgi:hypothetical protein